MCTNAQKRSWRKHSKPWTAVSSGELEEVDKRKKLLLLSIYWVVLGCFTKRIYLLLTRVENKKLETIKRSVVARVWWEGKWNKGIAEF